MGGFFYREIDMKCARSVTLSLLILKKDRWLRAIIACNKLLEKALLPSGLLSIQQMLVTLLSDKISMYMLIIVYMLNGHPIV